MNGMRLSARETPQGLKVQRNVMKNTMNFGKSLL